MGQKTKLKLTPILFLLLAISACKKEGGDNGRTTIRKGTASTKIAAKKAGTDGAGVPGSPGKVTKSSCSELEAAAKTSGWVIKSLNVPEGLDNKKQIKIRYFILKDTEGKMVNPVLYLNRSAFQEVNVSDLNDFSKFAHDYKIDPVLISMRGADCSSPLPDAKSNISLLNNYGSKSAVADAELIRKALLGDKKWKVMAHRSGGAVALRYVQLFPTSIKSVHIADFSPIENQTELMKYRINKEAQNWESLVQEFNLSEDAISSVQKKLEAGNCKPLADCHVLIDLYSGSRISDKTQWSSIAESIKKIADGKTTVQELLKNFESRKKVRFLNSVARILDLDSDKNLSGCAEALKTEKGGFINSCRLEIELAKSDTANLKTLSHDPLNLKTIQDNLKKHDIPYYLYSGGLSSLYPRAVFMDHVEEFADALSAQNWITLDDKGSEIYKSSNFLGSLNQ
jgi:pimeloyl-ACP methyl ester carboxylesterase